MATSEVVEGWEFRTVKEGIFAGRHAVNMNREEPTTCRVVGDTVAFHAMGLMFTIPLTVIDRLRALEAQGGGG